MKGLREKILQRIQYEPNSGCWLWDGYCDKDGYGKVTFNQYPRSVHRWMYIFEYGDIPKGLIVRHKCNEPSCCNPQHLHLGTQKENIQDMVNAGRAVWQKPEVIASLSANSSHCKNGHAYDEVGFYKDKWGRRCKACAKKSNALAFKKKTMGKIKPTHWRKSQTHCKQGHEFTVENTRWRGKNKTQRDCKQCQRDAGKKYRLNKKDK